MSTITHRIFVPAPGEDLGIAPGSAIVAAIDQASEDRVLVYYEGNLFGACNLRRFVERVLHAADRQVARYPTIAKASFPRSVLIEVAAFDYTTGKITAITNAAALRAWVPDEPAFGVG